MRPSWEEYFMKIAYIVAERSTCMRRKVGAVIVRDNRILSTGYSGAPSGLPHCDEIGGCLRDKMKVPSGERAELCRAAHAELNAISQAAQYGVGIMGSAIYCTDSPCSFCAKAIINSKIITVIYDGEYPDTMAFEMFAGAGIVLKKIEKELKT